MTGRFDVMYTDSTPELSYIKDSRENGICFEANQARISVYLQHTYPGKKLEEFSLPGIQHLRLNYGDIHLSKTSDFFLQLLVTLDVSAQSTWVVDITDSGVWPGDKALLSSVLHKLPSIKTLYWREGEPIPLDIVHFLETNHPHCQLHYEPDFGYWGPADGSIRRHRHSRRKLIDEELLATEEQNAQLARQSILNSTVLYSLKVQVSNGGRERDPSMMDLILQILTTCPNIKGLDISISRGSGCVIYDTDDLYAFDFTSSNANLAPLESLTLDGYLLHAKPNGLKWREWETDHPERHILNAPWKYLPDSAINYIGYSKIKDWGGLQTSFVKRDTSLLKPGTKTNIDVWLERMDWTHLRTLKMKDASRQGLDVLGGNILPSLRNVEFSGYYSHHHAILDFLSNSSFTLESIKLNGIAFCSITQVISSIVEHHDSSLHTLVIKHSQPSRPYYGGLYDQSRRNKPYRYPSTSFLNITHIAQLRDSIPGLTTLDLDIFVGEEWDYELLDTLNSFPELECLTLRFEAPVGGWDDEDKDELDEEAIVYHQYGQSNEYIYKEIDHKLYLMMGLKEYLTKEKLGKPYKKLETWVGSEIVRGTGETS
ncbi:hypothetical protein N431DRAFT_433090 [Stipitochalara longipes BDJ]|nr:hypothetical protein N431DRAFT_433090 [Stipitochalara longipes BDJ]